MSKQSRHLVSLHEAAKYLGVTTKTVRRFISAGELPAYRLGPRMVRVDVAEVDALLVRIPAGDVA